MAEPAYHAPINSSPQAAWIPELNDNGKPAWSRKAYTEFISGCPHLEPLLDACKASRIKLGKTCNLSMLRTKLIEHWYPSETSSTTMSAKIKSTPPLTVALPPLPDPPLPTPPFQNEFQTDLDNNPFLNLPVAPPLFRSTSNVSSILDMDEAALVREFGGGCPDAEDILGFDDADDESDESEGEDVDEPEEIKDMNDDEYEAYKTQTRVDETLRFENNRRKGGRYTQKSTEKAWNAWVALALKLGQIKDNIIDEHHLLLWVRYCSERPKQDRRGRDIPGTLLGASQIKKLYFGVLRIRKLQDAKDARIRLTRPAASSIVWDATKTRMREALERVRGGEIPGEDAPDIVKNTFLDSVTDAQLAAVGDGFLMHRHLHSVINGHLAWTAQRASANRGDDFRALKLAELQPHTFMHPNGQTGIECVLALQGEEKAGGGRGMKTKVNPVYTAFIAHRRPERCPLGAFMLYHHYIHDVKKVSEIESIDWSWNSSWRQIRILHGPKSFTTPYNEQNLYNLYKKAFEKAKFESAIVVHLPRHLLPAELEDLGVSAQETSKLGRWSEGSVYHDHYAPALPKAAILGAHGYKVHEDYNPTWRHVHVPERFLKLMCPMAEEIHEQVVGRKNLLGSANYWSMVINHRRYGFLAAAAIYQRCPTSALFRLPALANEDVRNWMKNDYPAALAELQANEANPIDLGRVQNDILRMALEEMRSLLAEQGSILKAMGSKLERRTEVFSPSKSFSNQVYQERFHTASTEAHFPSTSSTSNHTDPPQINWTESLDNTGIYTSGDQADDSLRAFANESPKQPSTSPRAKSQVDLILPPLAAFSKPDEPQLMWPPILGQRSIMWTQVYPLIKRPEMLWEYWGPSKTVNSYSLNEIWASYNEGERVYNGEGVQVGVKPPIRQVEQHFQHKWRKGGKERKAWERYREIPEYVERESSSRGISPDIVLEELRVMQQPDPSKPQIGLSALSAMIKELRKAGCDGEEGSRKRKPGTSHQATDKKTKM